MGSKREKTQVGRKERYQRQLENRIAVLSEKKTDPAKIEKDPLVKSLRASIAAMDVRLKAIAALVKRNEDVARKKAEKSAAPPVAEPVVEKDPKKAPAEPTPKKKKAEQ